MAGVVKLVGRTTNTTRHRCHEAGSICVVGKGDSDCHGWLVLAFQGDRYGRVSRHPNHFQVTDIAGALDHNRLIHRAGMA